MIRRDYILRMIEEVIRALSQINRLKRERRFSEAREALDEQFTRLIGSGARAVSGLTETELLAKLMQGEPTQVVHEKTLLLTALLKEAADVFASEGRVDESRDCSLKGLHLLLAALAKVEPFECPDFVPKVEAFVEALRDRVLPMKTLALLMQHYERVQEFGKAEDALYSLLEQDPNNGDIVELGISFYTRLQSHSDAVLESGNLPRTEVEAGLQEWRQGDVG